MRLWEELVTRAAGEDRVPLSGPSAALVRHMTASLEVPTATTMRTFEVARLDEYTRDVPKSARPSLGCILAYAVATATRLVPRIRSRYVREAGRAYVVVGEQTHLGVAVDVAGPRAGRIVVVPVMANATGVSFAEFGERYEDLTRRAKNGGLQVGELQDANVIVTNTAAFGSTTGIARLPAGVGAIVALGTIGYPAGFSRLAAKLDIDRIMTASCTYDHRVIQGGDSGQFLEALAGTLADPAFYGRLRGGQVGETALEKTALEGEE